MYFHSNRLRHANGRVRVIKYNVCLQWRQTLYFITPGPEAGSSGLMASGGIEFSSSISASTIEALRRSFIVPGL